MHPARWTNNSILNNKNIVCPCPLQGHKEALSYFFWQDDVICLCHPKLLQIKLRKNKSILWCDNSMDSVCLGLGTKMSWLGLQKDHGFGAKEKVCWSVLKSNVLLTIILSSDFLLGSCHNFYDFERDLWLKCKYNSTVSSSRSLKTNYRN